MPFIILPIALLLAAACALLDLWLGFRIAQVRRRERIFIGDGGSEALVRRMRAQANFVESAPFVLALVALIELCTGSHGWLAVVAGLFVAARLVHPFGMDGWAAGRMIGAGITMLVLVLLALWAVAIPVVARYELHRAAVAAAVPAG